MTNTRRRFTIQEKLAILNEADRFGTAHTLSKYGLSASVLYRWQKDLNKSKARQVAVKRNEDAQTIESLRDEVERLKKKIADQAAPVQRKEQKPEIDKRIANEKEKELLHLVATLIVEKVLRDVDEELGPDDLLIHDSNL